MQDTFGSVVITRSSLWLSKSISRGSTAWLASFCSGWWWVRDRKRSNAFCLTINSADAPSFLNTTFFSILQNFVSMSGLGFVMEFVLLALGWVFREWDFAFSNRSTRHYHFRCFKLLYAIDSRKQLIMIPFSMFIALLLLHSPLYFPIFLLFWVILNVTGAFVDLSDQSRFYLYNFVLPVYNAVDAAKSIMFGTKNHLVSIFDSQLLRGGDWHFWTATPCLFSSPSFKTLSSVHPGSSLVLQPSCWRQSTKDQRLQEMPELNGKRLSDTLNFFLDCNSRHSFISLFRIF